MIKLHFYEDDKDICSIKGIGDSSPGHDYLLVLLRFFLENSKDGFVVARRNNFDLTSLMQKIQIEKLLCEIDCLQYSDDQFELSFTFHAEKRREELVYLLERIWFSYEQPVFCFYEAGINGDRNDVDFRLIEKLSWKQIISHYNGFVFFRSAEDDVLWIGKSQSQFFNLPA
ncbi:hypothetical protein [Chitinophaga sp. XS-30]|uniref:hypothetical protein n=1 Tax=Chitinophaga sp. XS-30 TaxID=2604421 RepID=UPI0011DD3310|nr:hypothetical protein [Chitinophaga sp. XS-30]QEH43311.1 hypothetical protein FW415_21585 [Chitinophaga sp. XS-30]